MKRAYWQDDRPRGESTNDGCSSLHATAWAAASVAAGAAARASALLIACAALSATTTFFGGLGLAHAQPVALPVPPSSLPPALAGNPPVANTLTTAPRASSTDADLHANDDAPCAARATLPTPPAGDPAALDAAIDAWLQVLGTCQRDPVYLMTLGQMLSRQGRYLEASDHLERALLFKPDLKEARVDYAIALAGAGDTPSALAMLADLLAEPDLPSHLRASLQRQRTALAGAAAPAWETRLVAAARVGRDNNLSGAPNLGSLTLTIAGQPVLLPLDETYQARAGVYARADLQLEARRNNADGSQWNVLASLRTRHSPSIANTGTSTADVVVERTHYGLLPGTNHASGYYASASAGLLQAQAGTRYHALGLGAGWGAHWREGWARDCQTRLGGEAQHRQHQTNGILTGHYLGLAAVVSCEQTNGAQWLASLRSGQDRAQSAERPGGNQQQSSLRLAGYLPLAAWVPAGAEAAAWAAWRRGSLLLDLETSHYRDATGYSPLLQNGALRIQRRYTARLEYQFSVAKTLQWTVGAEWVQQRSSLDLFRLQSYGPYTALRASW